MARSKITSQNIAILVAEAQGTGAYTGPYFPEPIAGINSCDFNINITREDVPGYGQYISDKVPVVYPNVDLNFSFYSISFVNEGFIGLNVEEPTQNCLKYILDKSRDQRNYFVFVAPEGADAYGLSGADEGVAILGIGNCYLSSYSVSAAVGDFPVTSVTVQGMNVRSYTGGVMKETPEINPIINEEHSSSYFEIGQFGLDPLIVNVVRPGDIEVDFSSVDDLFYTYSGASVQSFNISLNLQRQEITHLGQKYPHRKDVILPVDVSFQAVIRAKDLNNDSLQQYLCGTGLYNANIRFKRASCGGDGEEIIGYSIRGLRLDSQSSSFGGPSEPQMITTNWTAQILGTGDSSRGLFMSGSFDL